MSFIFFTIRFLLLSKKVIIQPINIDDEQLKTENSINIDFDQINRSTLLKSIFSQPEKLPGQEDLPIHIPKEHIEQWICQ